MEIDWSLCIICQQKNSETLKCPLDSPAQKRNKSEAYEAFLKNVEEFCAIDALPLIVTFGNDQSSENFAFHRASCLAKFNNCKLERAKSKRKTDVAESETTPRRKRQKLYINLCFLCEKGIEVGELHKVSTLNANTNIKRMITELNDPNLLVKIVGTDLIAKGIRYHLNCLVELRNRYRSMAAMRT